MCNWQGEVVMAFTRRLPSPYEPLVAECMAIREGLVIANQYGVRISEVENNSLTAVQDINKLSVSLFLDSIVYDIRKLLSELGGGTCRYISRNRNVGGHTLA